MMVSLDGYIEGPDHDLSWHHVDDEFNAFAARQMEEMGAILFGRRTYELMASYWPTEKPSDPDDAIVAQKMNSLPKIVFSKTLKNIEEKPHWQNIQLITTDIAKNVQELKQKEGKSIAVLGSNTLCVSLLEMGLLDELRIMINPVVIGKGTPLFRGIQRKLSLKLVETKVFYSGNVLFTYHIDQQSA